MKIEGHGQAKILTQEEIELLFNKGLLSSRDRTLFGVCLYTACRIAEACSLMVKDIYTNSGTVRSTINERTSPTLKENSKPGRFRSLKTCDRS
jgi:integrase/recombinase XerD